jgi:hypothetical protein
MRKLFLAALLVPALAFAQSETTLRQQIRADLMSDPRTAQMSLAELDALVEALATEATESGEAATYLDVKAAPTFTYDPPPTGAENAYVAVLTTPIFIAIFALLAGIFGVILFMLLRKKHSNEATLEPVA